MSLNAHCFSCCPIARLLPITLCIGPKNAFVRACPCYVCTVNMIVHILYQLVRTIFIMLWCWQELSKTYLLHILFCYYLGWVANIATSLFNVVIILCISFTLKALDVCLHCHFKAVKVIHIALILNISIKKQSTWWQWFPAASAQGISLMELYTVEHYITGRQSRR